jgi:hypothetical protein
VAALTVREPRNRARLPEAKRISGFFLIDAARKQNKLSP